MGGKPHDCALTQKRDSPCNLSITQYFTTQHSYFLQLHDNRKMQFFRPFQHGKWEKSNSLRDSRCYFGASQSTMSGFVNHLTLLNIPRLRLISRLRPAFLRKTLQLPLPALERPSPGSLLRKPITANKPKKRSRCRASPWIAGTRPDYGIIRQNFSLDKPRPTAPTAMITASVSLSIL